MGSASSDFNLNPWIFVRVPQNLIFRQFHANNSFMALNGRDVSTPFLLLNLELLKMQILPCPSSANKSRQEQTGANRRRRFLYRPCPPWLWRLGGPGRCLSGPQGAWCALWLHWLYGFNASCAPASGVAGRKSLGLLTQLWVLVTVSRMSR